MGEFGEAESSYQSYSVGELLFFATGGRLCSPIHQQAVEPILDLASYMTGLEDVNILELQGIATRCRDAVIAQHPELAEIAAKVETGELEPLYQACNGDTELWHERLQAWLDAQQEVPHPLELIPLSDFERDPRSIVEQAIEAAGPHAQKLFLAHYDDEGRIVFPE